MESVLELKGKLQNVYAQYSTYIDKVVRFVLAFVAFFMINREIGYMHMHGESSSCIGAGCDMRFSSANLHTGSRSGTDDGTCL